ALRDRELLVEGPDLVDERLREERHRRDEILLQDRKALALRTREAALVARPRRVDPSREEPVAVRGRDPVLTVVGLHERLDVPGQEDVVGIAEGDQLAAGLGDAAVPGGRDARVLLAHDTNPLRERARDR